MSHHHAVEFVYARATLDDAVQALRRLSPESLTLTASGPSEQAPVYYGPSYDDLPGGVFEVHSAAAVGIPLPDDLPHPWDDSDRERSVRVRVAVWAGRSYVLVTLESVASVFDPYFQSSGWLRGRLIEFADDSGALLALYLGQGTHYAPLTEPRQARGPIPDDPDDADALAVALLRAWGPDESAV